MAGIVFFPLWLVLCFGTGLWRAWPLASFLVTMALLASAVGRVALVTGFDRLFDRSPEWWLRGMAGTILVNGVTWGLMGGLVQWEFGMEWISYAVGLTTVGFAASGMVTQVTHLTILRAFVFSITAPLFLVVALSGGSQGIVLGTMYAAYPIFLSQMGARFHRNYWKRLVYRSLLKERAEELEEQKVRAEAANRAKTEFLSRMSHELRTPLTAILGFSELLKMDGGNGLSPVQRKRVDHIIDSGNHLVRLINEVLDLARIESGALDLSVAPVDVSTLFESCSRLIAAEADRRRVTVRFEPVEPADLTVLADPTRVKQVLVNLLSNAVKYNHHDGSGGVVVRGRRTKAGVVGISVTDTGPGIPKNRQTELFRAFSRLDAGATGIEGTGIGLVISKQLIERQGGTIGFESETGIGSTFWFELPEVIRKTTGSTAASAAVEDAEGGRFGAGKTVVYIEDNTVNRMLLEQLMATRTEAEFVTEEDAEAGLATVAALRPDLVLLDITLPGMDGFEVLRRLRQDPTTRDIPVVALSANAMSEDIREAETAGFDGYLTKPLEIPRFLDTLRDRLNGEDGR